MVNPRKRDERVDEEMSRNKRRKLKEFKTGHRAEVINARDTHVFKVGKCDKDALHGDTEEDEKKGEGEYEGSEYEPRGDDIESEEDECEADGEVIKEQCEGSEYEPRGDDIESEEEECEAMAERKKRQNDKYNRSRRLKYALQREEKMCIEKEYSNTANAMKCFVYNNMKRYEQTNDEKYLDKIQERREVITKNEERKLKETPPKDPLWDQFDYPLNEEFILQETDLEVSRHIARFCIRMRLMELRMKCITNGAKNLNGRGRGHEERDSHTDEEGASSSNKKPLRICLFAGCALPCRDYKKHLIGVHKIASNEVLDIISLTTSLCKTFGECRIDWLKNHIDLEELENIKNKCDITKSITMSLLFGGRKLEKSRYETEKKDENGSEKIKESNDMKGNGNRNVKGKETKKDNEEMDTSPKGKSVHAAGVLLSEETPTLRYLAKCCKCSTIIIYRRVHHHMEKCAKDIPKSKRQKLVSKSFESRRLVRLTQPMARGCRNLLPIMENKDEFAEGSLLSPCTEYSASSDRSEDAASPPKSSNLRSSP